MINIACIGCGRIFDVALQRRGRCPECDAGHVPLFRRILNKIGRKSG